MADSAESMEQSLKDRKVCAMVDKLFKEAKQHKAQFDYNWIENYNFFRGDQWSEKRPAYRHSEVMNLTHAAIQTIIPILTDNRPNIEALPEEPSDFEFAEIMTELHRSKWDREQWGMVVAEGLIDAMIYGTSIFKVIWRPEKLDGLGDYTFEIVDPLHFYPDPRARDINDDFGKYVIEAVPTNVSEVQRLYPEKAKEIKGNLSTLSEREQNRPAIVDRNIRETAYRNTETFPDKPKRDDKEAQVLLITCWMHSDEVVEEQIEKQMKDGSTKKIKVERKKFPNGRKIVVANGVLLEDGDNPYLDGKFPYARLVDHIMPREFWGQGEIDQLKGPQKLINKLVSYMMDILALTGNPVWIVPTDSGVDTESITNEPGLIVEHNPEGIPQRVPGVMPSPVLQSMLNQFIDIYQQISGVNEVSQGALTSNSGIAIDLMQEAAQTKLRLKSRNLDTCLTKAGQLMNSRILQFYQTARVIRLTNNEEAIKYFKFAIDETADEAGEMGLVATVQPLQVTPEGGMMAEPVRQFEIKSNLDLRVTTGTELPLRKARKAREAKELYQAGIIDEEDLLDALEWPNAERTLKKFAERKAQQEQQAMAMAQMQQQGAMPAQ